MIYLINIENREIIEKYELEKVIEYTYNSITLDTGNGSYNKNYCSEEEQYISEEDYNS